MLSSPDNPSCPVRLPGNAVHPDPAAAGGAEAAGAAPVDVPVHAGVPHAHLLLELSPAGRLAIQVTTKITTLYSGTWTYSTLSKVFST